MDDTHRQLAARFYPESRFGGFTDVDGTVCFYQRVHALLRAEGTVIDFGCGRGRAQEDPVPYRRALCDLRATGRPVLGLDVDPAAADNQLVDQFHLLTEDQRWPVAPDSSQLVLCDMVLEHLSRPVDFLQEALRVLEPGGSLCIRTANAWGYVALVARLIPNRLHARVLGIAQPDRAAKDVFPTRYACNTTPAMRRALREVGFDAVVYGYEAEPSYLDRSAIAFAAGTLHQRWAPSILKQSIFAFARKPN